MKRKRQISKEISYKENDNTGLKQQSLSGNQTIDQRNIQPSVAICSVFKRIFDDLDLRPISKYNYVREGQNISTPKTPTCKRRCVLGVSLDSNQSTKTTEQRSCFTVLSCKNVYVSKSKQMIISYIYIKIYTQVFFNYSIIFHSQIREKKLVKKWLHTNVSFLTFCVVVPNRSLDLLCCGYLRFTQTWSFCDRSLLKNSKLQ
ncbi:BnaC06g42020D [Brassica napus]|uniref:BnaC06g42020D protein n=1 Tax=Brassica napus TaxID=3708 RepID=A0A078JH06_BRANA|nr:BnaC06g42020D [Brassica napus]